MPSPVLIVGGTGILGTDLTNCFNSHNEVVVSLGSKQLDITRIEQISATIERYRPKLVINAAAYTNVDGAESKQEQAFALNAKGPELLTKSCEKNKIKLIHFGTDQVFSGHEKTPRKESHTPCPSNFYAASKLYGDLEVLKVATNLVLRVQWLYGEKRDRFSSLREKEAFTPFADQFGAPTWTQDVAEVVYELAQKNASGLFHFAYDDSASWAEVFAYVKEVLSLEVELRPQLSAELKLPANRPLYSVLSNQKLLSILDRSKMGSWKNSLNQFLTQKGLDGGSRNRSIGDRSRRSGLSDRGTL